MLYKLFVEFSESPKIQPIDIIDGVLLFFLISLGGLSIGLLFAVIGSFTTKYFGSTPVLEPVVVLVVAYLSYLTAEMFSLSGIIAYN